MNEKLTIPTIAEMNAPEFRMKLCENDDKTWARLRLAIQTDYFVSKSWRDTLQKYGLNIEDIAQEVVKKLLKSNTYNPEQGASFTSWLHYVVRTRLIDLYNQWKKQNNGGNIESLDDPIMTNSVADSGKDKPKYKRDEVLDPHDTGEALEKRFASNVDIIGQLLSQIETYEVTRVEKIRSRIVDSLSSIPEVEYDKNRLEQELIYYIEKLDISEEKQRLANHLKYFRETMDNGDGQGKKLGFISQEMGREINTMGSKSNMAEMQNLVVQMKDQLEQIKEQVLNVL